MVSRLLPQTQNGLQQKTVTYVVMTEKHTSAATSRELLVFLQQEASYPHSPEQIIHIQTHISHVFIADPYVYKIKKPVDFGFLDYSTLEKRKYYCRQELELNRRLCEDVYLEVVPIWHHENGFGFNRIPGADVAEYAVKMKRLRDRYFLHNYIANNALEKSHLDRVAGRLAAFYLEQQPNDEVLEFGRISTIRVNTDENFSQTEGFIGQTIDRPAYKAIVEYTDRYFEEHEPMFNRRIQEKRIVDGHGDLHLEHIHVAPDKVRIYDCIEFNERFRYGDLAADLAFLAMDLNFYDRWSEERYFIEQMSERLDDGDLLKIVDFYKCYRAYVKGKVKSLQSAGEEVPEEERREAAAKAARYFDLSLHYALLGSDPVVLVFMGNVGTGKSTLAEHLSEKLDLPLYSSDRIRKTMGGIPLDRRTPDGKREKLYSAGMSDKTYGSMHQSAGEELRKGRCVVLDATYSSPARRETLRNILDALDAGYLFIECRADDATIRNRLKQRETNGKTISDARLEDLDKLGDIYSPPREIDDRYLVTIDTGRSLEKTMEELYMKIVGRTVKNVV